MTDASKSSKYVGGGYLSACGRLDFFLYGRGARRKPIDYLEGDTFIVAFRRMGRYWKLLMIRCWIDNMSFKGCMDKGRSSVERLNVLVREMYALSLEHQCIISPGFVPTLENGAADFLSRPAVQLGDPIAQVTAIAVDMHFWAPGTVAVVGPYAGGTRTLDEERGVLRKEVGFQQVLSADAKVFTRLVCFWEKSSLVAWKGMALTGVGGSLSGCSWRFCRCRGRLVLRQQRRRWCWPLLVRCSWGYRFSTSGLLCLLV